jgi:predicted LPLAT superfamily acyltransferase
LENAALWTFYLAMKYGVLVSLLGMKEGNRNYIFSHPPKLYRQQATSAKRDEMLTTIVDDYISELEKNVNAYPYQWFNYYNFWHGTEGN